MKKKLSFIIACLFMSCFILGSCSKETVKTDPELAGKLTESDILLSQYNLNGAKGIFQELLKKDSGNSDVNFRLAKLEYHFDQKYDLALERIKKSIKKDAEKSMYYELEGEIYSALEKYKESVESYKLALGKANPSSNIYPKLAKAYIALGNRADAIKTLEEGFKVNPYNTQISLDLHRLYVYEENYDGAYNVWKTYNLVAEGKTPLGYIGEWNLLYKKALESKGHYEMGDMYYKIHLYDEAVSELDKAIKAGTSTEDAKRQFTEAQAFVTFRDDLVKRLDTYYRDAAVKGSYVQGTLYSDLMPAYDKIAVIFPNIQMGDGYTKAKFDAINKSVQEKFGVLISYLQVDSYLDCYFGYIIGQKAEKVDHWGQKADEKVTTIRDMLSNGFNWWYNFKQGGTGGWTSIPGEFVYVMRPQSSIEAYNWAISDKIKGDMLLEAKKLSPNPDEKKPLDVYYSQHLLYQFAFKYLDDRIEGGKKMGLSGDELKAYTANLLLEDYYNVQILVHEGQHALDLQFNNIATKAELEYRAKLSEMAYGNDQFICLNEFMQPNMGNSKDPHGLANEKLFKDMTKYIYDHKDNYTSIDTTKNILSQMINLTTEEIREIAIDVFKEKYPSSK